MASYTVAEAEFMCETETSKYWGVVGERLPASIATQTACNEWVQKKQVAVNEQFAVCIKARNNLDKAKRAVGLWVDEG